MGRVSWSNGLTYGEGEGAQNDNPEGDSFSVVFRDVMHLLRYDF
jgi:hypothetical protein